MKQYSCTCTTIRSLPVPKWNSNKRMLPNGFWCIQILNKCRCERTKKKRIEIEPEMAWSRHEVQNTVFVCIILWVPFLFFSVAFLWNIFFHGSCWFLAHFRFSSKSFSMYFATRKTHTFASLNLYSYCIYVYRYCHVSYYLQPHIGQTKLLKSRIKNYA